MNIDDIVDELYPDINMLRMDGYDDCIIGIVERCTMEPIICYDVDKVIKKNMQFGMTEEEAVEYYSHNQLGAWVGTGTPCFLETYND